MKKIKISFIIIITMFFASTSLAQSNLAKYTFFKPFTISSVSSSSLYSFYPISIRNANPVPQLANFHYTAFFCKMELKALNHFGIWVKVHAGDYDNYTSRLRLR